MLHRITPFFLFLAFFLFSIPGSIAQTVDMVGPAGSVAFGTSVVALPNGNYVVTDPFFGEGGIDSIGAVYLYNGNTNTIISTLKGSTKNDQIANSYYAILVLSNGNFLVRSPNWNNGLATKAGAVTWCNGSTGLNGVIDATNSLVGNHINDSVGIYVDTLSNSNYIINSPNWNGKMGAATLCNALGTHGVIDISNSLIGSTPGDQVASGGSSKLNNGNYVVNSPNWNNGKGAATWVNGATGLLAVVDATNSLVGTNNGDQVGQYATPLANGNYVVNSPNWNGTIGAVTWGNGTIGIIGPVNTANSLTGSSFGDKIGYGLAPLTNGNYVVFSTFWNGNRGAVRWMDGTATASGTLTTANSLTGSNVNDNIAQPGIFPLTNGNYVVLSFAWNSYRGAATWVNGGGAVSGNVSAANSLVGSNMYDYVGMDGTALSNGNYMITNQFWNGSAGAVTWGNGTKGVSGAVSSSNSLVGNSYNEQVGGVVWTLRNGAYVIVSTSWNNYTGAVTWGNGTAPILGHINANNSLIGYALNNNGSAWSGAVLTNGNYVVGDIQWSGNKGATTLCNGSKGTTGVINSGNSLIGNAGDLIGSSGVRSLPNGNYYVVSPNYNGGQGAVTWGYGTGGTVNAPTNCNSVFGTLTKTGAYQQVAYDSINNFLIVGHPANNNISRFYPALGATLPNYSDNSSGTLSGNMPFVFPTTTGCGQMAALAPSGANPASGVINAKTWFESPQPSNFMARHYEITPATNASTTSGTVTLYFTQSDFDGFNNQSPKPVSLLPIGPNDAAGKSHLLVEKQGGTSSVGTGLPGTYPGPTTTIDPADSNIVWNTTLQRWEVSFDVTSFSGFFVKTQSATVVLPLALLNFSGESQGSTNLLQWATANETGTKTFVVESSTDGSNFSPVGSMAATGGGKYNYVDANPIISRTYYRLKIVDADGRFTYSNIIWISGNGHTSISLYPNPAYGSATLNTGNNLQLIGSVALFTDASGKLLRTISINYNQVQINLSAIPAGVYFLKLANGEVLKVMKH